MHSRKLKWVSPLFIIFLALASVFGATSAIVGSQRATETPVMEKAEATDYSSTIRVYVDMTWSGVSDVRIGTDQTSGRAILTSSNTSKYNQSYKFVRDISSSYYERMGCFFIEGSTWWFYKDNGGYIDSPGGWGFSGGNEYLIKDIGYEYDSGNNKAFHASVEYLGPITEPVDSPTVYFVNGYSWEEPRINYFGGTASVDYPGSKMSPTISKLHCKVGDTWFDIGIFTYTISGSASFIQFNKGDSSEQTDKLRPVNDGIYWFGVSSETYEGVASFLVSFMNAMGSHVYNGKTYPNSLCSFSSSQAGSFISTYGTLSSSDNPDVVTSITNSTINTYSVPVLNPSTKSDIKMPVLIAQVTKNNTNGVYSAIRSFFPFNLIGDDNNNITTIIIVVASSVALLSVTALSILVIKKRKHKEQE